MIGSRFGRLEVIGQADNYTPRRPYLRCACDCGVIVSVLKHSLTSGRTSSCGCLQRELASQSKIKHGLSRHPAYRTWYGMQARCYDRRHKFFADYGGRGIRVCDEWRAGPDAFIAWAEAEGWRKGLNVDREHNDGDYSPSNCRVASKTTNANNKRNNRLVEIHGEQMTIADAARRFGLSYQTVSARLRKGWVEDRLVSPARPKARAA